MLYDVFDLRKVNTIARRSRLLACSRQRLLDGRLEVPEFESEEVLKPESTKGG